MIALHQAGVEEAVAVMGTAITPEQLRAARRYTDEVVLALDADGPGGRRCCAPSASPGAARLRLRVAAMPAGEDPAD